MALVYYYFDPKGQSEDSHRATLIATTLVVVMFSITVFGAVTKPLLDFTLGMGQGGKGDVSSLSVDACADTFTNVVVIFTTLCRELLPSRCCISPLERARAGIVSHTRSGLLSAMWLAEYCFQGETFPALGVPSGQYLSLVGTAGMSAKSLVAAISERGRDAYGMFLPHHLCALLL